MNPTIHLIDDLESLQNYCDAIKDVKVLALDTEFIREKTYYPKLCLIQIATEDTLACIDTISISNIDPLLDILYDDNIVKVLHAASQDLEIFYHLKSALPQNIFDTQIAASLLGHGEQIGYANLMKMILNVDLDKGQSRTNWEQRPLSDKQIQYAANDVLYLLQAYPLIQNKIEEQNRLDWLKQNTQRLTNQETYEVHLDQIWQRVKQSNKLRGVQIAILQSLARWREEKAIAKNLPRKWIVNDDVLFDLARIKPTDESELENIRDIGKYEKSFDTFLELIELALALPKDQWPAPKNFIKLTPEQSAQIDIITAIIKLKAEEHKISQNNIATKKELEQLVTGNKEVKLLKQVWLYELAGKAILDFIEGRVAIHINANNKIEFTQD